MKTNYYYPKKLSNNNRSAVLLSPYMFVIRQLSTITHSSFSNAFSQCGYSSLWMFGGMSTDSDDAEDDPNENEEAYEACSTKYVKKNHSSGTGHPKSRPVVCNKVESKMVRSLFQESATCQRDTFEHTRSVIGGASASLSDISQSDRSTQSSYTPLSSSPLEGRRGGFRMSEKGFLRSAGAQSIERTHQFKASETWRPGSSWPIRRLCPTDFSGLKHQERDWEVTEFSGGATTRRDPRQFVHGAFWESDEAECLREEKGSEDFIQSYTPRQRKLYESLDPPDEITAEHLAATPSVENELLDGVSPDQKSYIVKSMFKEFVVELTRGAFFTQLTAQRDYVTLFCQLREDLEALTLDQNSGRRIEFPLKGTRPGRRRVRVERRKHTQEKCYDSLKQCIEEKSC